MKLYQDHRGITHMEGSLNKISGVNLTLCCASLQKSWPVVSGEQPTCQWCLAMKERSNG